MGPSPRSSPRTRLPTPCILHPSGSAHARLHRSPWTSLPWTVHADGRHTSNGYTMTPLSLAPALMSRVPVLRPHLGQLHLSSLGENPILSPEARADTWAPLRKTGEKLGKPSWHREVGRGGGGRRVSPRTDGGRARANGRSQRAGRSGGEDRPELGPQRLGMALTEESRRRGAGSRGSCFRGGRSLAHLAVRTGHGWHTVPSPRDDGKAYDGQSKDPSQLGHSYYFKRQGEGHTHKDASCSSGTKCRATGRGWGPAKETASTTRR